MTPLYGPPATAGIGHLSDIRCRKRPSAPARRTERPQRSPPAGDRLRACLITARKREFRTMRWSTMHIPTLRDDPADAGAPSHRLLLRAGYIRPLMAGHYSLLPLGQRVRLKVIKVIREEMDRIGAQEG